MHQDYDLGEHHSRLLTMACEAWDRAVQAREILAKDGIVIGGREAAVRPHPCIAIERDARIAFARLIAQLNLDAEVTRGPQHEGGAAQYTAWWLARLQWSAELAQ